MRDKKKVWMNGFWFTVRQYRKWLKESSGMDILRGDKWHDMTNEEKLAFDRKWRMSQQETG